MHVIYAWHLHTANPRQQFFVTFEHRPEFKVQITPSGNAVDFISTTPLLADVLLRLLDGEQRILQAFGRKRRQRVIRVGRRLSQVTLVGEQRCLVRKELNLANVTGVLFKLGIASNLIHVGAPLFVRQCPRPP